MIRGSDYKRSSKELDRRLPQLATNLPERLIERDAHCGRKIKASFIGRLGDSQELLRKSPQNRVGKAVRLAAEDQAVAVRKICIPKRSRCFAAEKPEAGCGDRFEKCIAVVVYCEFQSRPIVHGAAAEVVIREDKTEWPHQMKRRARRNAQPRDVAGVGSDLRLKERDAQVM
jgi:hypothetical protein